MGTLTFILFFCVKLFNYSHKETQKTSKTSINRQDQSTAQVHLVH